MKLVNIGFGNLINAQRVVSVLSPESAPVKRIIQASKENSKLIDATHGRKTKSVIITDCDITVISYLDTESVLKRFEEEE